MLSYKVSAAHMLRDIAVVAFLEFPSNFGQENPVTACVPPEIEDSTVCHLFSGRLTVK